MQTNKTIQAYIARTRAALRARSEIRADRTTVATWTAHFAAASEAFDYENDREPATLRSASVAAFNLALCAGVTK